MPYQPLGVPGLDGVLASRANQEADQQNQLRGLLGMLSIQNQMAQQQRLSQMAPLEMALKKAQIDAIPEQAKLRAAQTQEALAKVQQGNIQNTGLSGLYGLLGGNPGLYGGNVNAVVSPNAQPTGMLSGPDYERATPQERAAMEAVYRSSPKAVESAASPGAMTVGVPNPGAMQAYALMADRTGGLLKNLGLGATTGKDFTLSRGATRYDASGKPIVTAPGGPATSPYTNVRDNPLRPGSFIGLNKETNRIEEIPTSSGLAPPKISLDTHGEDFLKTLEPQVAAQVKAIAEGRQAVPSGFALKSPYWQNLMTMVSQYDPNYSQARAAVQKDFTSGPTAKNITSANTVIAHIGTLNDMIDALDNKDLRVVNMAINRLKTETGNPNVNNFDTAKQAVGNELMRVFRQVNASESETRDWEKRFQSSSSPAQLRGAVKVGVELLKGRLDAIDDQWNRAMNTDKGFPNLVSPKSQAVLKRIGLSVGREGGIPSNSILDQADAILRGK